MVNVCQKDRVTNSVCSRDQKEHLLKFQDNFYVNYGAGNFYTYDSFEIFPISNNELRYFEMQLCCGLDSALKTRKKFLNAKITKKYCANY